MSTISGSLPAGLQDLSNAGLLPSGLSTQQLSQATPAELTQNVVDNVELSTVSALFGDTSSTASNSNQSLTSALLGGSTTSASNTDPILQALDSALTSASSNTTQTATSGSATTAAAEASAASIGSLFSFMG